MRIVFRNERPRPQRPIFTLPVPASGRTWLRAALRRGCIRAYGRMQDGSFIAIFGPATANRARIESWVHNRHGARVTLIASWAEEVQHGLN